MVDIAESKRLIKRVLLANIVNDKKDLALTPLISGKHGIGKSQIIKSVAKDINGVCITIEGGTLKEGEITGLPYQYRDENGRLEFKFLPYYAIERIQDEEKRLYDLLNCNKNKTSDLLMGDDNKYQMNDIDINEKLRLIKNNIVRPVIIFIDEINRTENVVYKELMNILLTRSVNGYNFPWWVFFVGAMNPSTQNSVYSTNEMDPAQLDRFIKIKVSDNAKEWLKYAKSANINESIQKFIKENPKCLSSNDKMLDDDEKPTPSPRGWDMVDSLLKSEPLLRDFFTEEENKPNIIEKDLKNLISAKIGITASTMFFANLVLKKDPVTPDEIFSDDVNLQNVTKRMKELSPAKKVQSSNLLLDYLIENIDFMILNKQQFETQKCQLKIFVELLDSSTKLLFAQKLIEAESNLGTSLMDELFDIFEKDLTEMLDLSDAVKAKIEGKK